VCIVLSIILIVNNWVPAYADEPDDEAVTDLTACFPLDIVFLIDQSESMSRSHGGGLPNDPYYLRKYAVDWVITWLGDNVLTYCPEVVHRIAVISWGSEARIDMSLTLIAPKNEDVWETRRAELKENIVLDSIGETNPLLAFEAARTVFNNASRLDNNRRKQVIVFVTDGEPYFEGMVGPGTEYTSHMVDQVLEIFPFSENLMEQEICIQDAVNTYGDYHAIPVSNKNQCLLDNKVDENGFLESTYIWAILLNKGSDYLAAVQDDIEQMTGQHAAETYRLIDNSDIPVTFLEIMSRLSGIKADRIGCGPVFIEPYLKGVFHLL